MIDVDHGATLAGRRVVAVGHAGDEELFLDIPEPGEVERCGVVRVAVIEVAERRCVGDRPGDVRRSQHDVVGLLTSRDGREREGHCCTDEQTTHGNAPV